MSFRNLKDATDKALALYGDENAREIVFKKPYEEQKKAFDEKLAELRERAPTLESIDAMQSEEEKAAFVKTFRDLLRIKSSLETYSNFSFEELSIGEQEFYDYQSKYLDIHDERKKDERVQESILDQIDFELELTVRDVINFDYLIKLLAGLKNTKSASMRQKKTEEILRVFDRDVQLRKKKELIQQFIEANLPLIKRSDDVEKAFTQFWDHERSKMLRGIAEAESIPLNKLEKLISEYIYTHKLPKAQDIADTLPNPPPILKRKTIVERIQNAIENLVDVFEW